MTIHTNHITLDRSEDPGYWYIWSNDFNGAFRLLFSQLEAIFNTDSYNLKIEPPIPSTIVMWHTYAHAMELYMKTYLLASNKVSLNDLRSKCYGHDLESLRKKCSEFDVRFNDKSLTRITQDLRRFTGIDWEYIKYPPRIPPTSKRRSMREGQHLPPMYGKDTMLPPLDLLDKIVKPLVYTEDNH